MSQDCTDIAESIIIFRLDLFHLSLETVFGFEEEMRKPAEQECRPVIDA